MVRMNEASTSKKLLCMVPGRKKGGKTKAEMDGVSANAKTQRIRNLRATARDREVWKAVLKAGKTQ